MSSGERPMGTAKGKQPNTEALCQPPPPPHCPPPHEWCAPSELRRHGTGLCEATGRRWHGRGAKGQKPQV